VDRHAQTGLEGLDLSSGTRPEKHAEHFPALASKRAKNHTLESVGATVTGDTGDDPVAAEIRAQVGGSDKNVGATLFGHDEAEAAVMTMQDSRDRIGEADCQTPTAHLDQLSLTNKLADQATHCRAPLGRHVHAMQKLSLGQGLVVLCGHVIEQGPASFAVGIHRPLLCPADAVRPLLDTVPGDC
jgi:hypothetical protein